MYLHLAFFMYIRCGLVRALEIAACEVIRFSGGLNCEIDKVSTHKKLDILSLIRQIVVRHSKYECY